VGRLLFVFLDGFGLAPAGPDNPLSLYPWPCLAPLLGFTPVAGQELVGPHRLLAALDCGLGVAGTPQSATGQVSLFTGENAAAMLGYHLAAYPNRRLKGLIEADNILKRVAAAGRRATFANAYSDQYFQAVTAGKLRHSATTLCVLAAGLRFRMVEDLRRGEAVYWDITGEHLRERSGADGSSRSGDASMPLVDPEEAGKRLAGLAGNHDLALFECFLPDLVGHHKGRAAAAALCERLDRFLAACISALDEETTLLLTSDHGNVEDLSSGAHTTNPVPLIVLGPAAPSFAAARAITDVAHAIYRVLAV